ncbi:SpoIIE family protein phosphatase [Streptomyces sp. ISL-112]|uniref:PP2C family protein-serine/threonine phosphatase n=1 Tax=unclassified Streptomyces TaxID=2593676 RepID=UPI001BE70F22|nr:MULTISPECIES: SpoIIE family protein phosphatase [unclassified Streptomyces]MBT2428086.1 SpoIIE family protein phosphatase [Streptomyces sp. ISL-112]MBT2463119.1 SpoIIE family protein phosphatase [Streptomyces sp. ISL-63]
MPSHLFSDRPAPQPPAHDAVDALIHRARRLRGDVDAVGRNTAMTDEDDPRARWQRALCDLAVQHLDNLDQHLGQLKAGPPAQRSTDRGDRVTADGASANRVGSAEWNLLTDEVSWSEELYEIFGRPPGSPPLSLDDLPSVLLPDDQPKLTSMVTGCLVDGQPMDGEFRIVLPDGQVRTLHMTGEPVLDSEGCTASMWAVLRDVGELRRSEETVSRNRDSARRDERTRHRMATEVQETFMPPWRGSLPLPAKGPRALDIAAHHLPSAAGGGLIGGDWYDAMELPDGRTLLSVGDLSGHGIRATSAMAMMLGALRGMAIAGIEPGALMDHLDHLLETSMQPALGSALCCRFDPATGLLSLAQAGNPAPLLFRDGTGRRLPSLEGALLGAASQVAYEQDEVRLLPGDVLVLHTDGLTRRGDRGAGPERLLALASRFAQARDAQECVRGVVEEFGGTERVDDACVLVARIGA